MPIVQDYGVNRPYLSEQMKEFSGCTYVNKHVVCVHVSVCVCVCVCALGLLMRCVVPSQWLFIHMAIA